MSNYDSAQGYMENGAKRWDILRGMGYAMLALVDELRLLRNKPLPVNPVQGALTRRLEEARSGIRE